MENVQVKTPSKLDNIKKYGVGATVFAVAAPSFAAFDTTALETDITANSASMQTVMLAVLTLVALFVGYKMIKRSMS